MLTANQCEQYRRDGYLVLRDQIDESELQRFERAFQRNPPLDGKESGTYPEPGRYTLAKSALADPDLAFIVEHPHIVTAAQQLLDDDIVLTAFVVYDRTAGGPGIPMHHDYKRWRPVGSSMNWLFTIIPLTDFDEQAGRLFIAPGSHHPQRVVDDGGRTLHITAAIKPDAEAFIDPQLKRGDLLLMNMHLWHQAEPNRSEHSRIGIFNKYAAASAPPATGYYLFNDAVYDALSEAGKPLIAVHSDKPIATTRLLLERNGKQGREYLFVKDQRERYMLPGGPIWKEQAIPDWDSGNYIGALQGHIREQLRIETPWLTYVGDFAEGDALTRVYAYALNGNGFPVPYEPDAQWLSAEAARAAGLAFGYESTAVERWLAPGVVRGKGLSQSQSRVDQFAY
jgi:hypothetical protein